MEISNRSPQSPKPETQNPKPKTTGQRSETEDDPSALGMGPALEVGTPMITTDELHRAQLCQATFANTGRLHQTERASALVSQMSPLTAAQRTRESAHYAKSVDPQSFPASRRWRVAVDTRAHPLSEV